MILILPLILIAMGYSAYHLIVLLAGLMLGSCSLYEQRFRALVLTFRG